MDAQAAEAGEEEPLLAPHVPAGLDPASATHSNGDGHAQRQAMTPAAIPAADGQPVRYAPQLEWEGVVEPAACLVWLGRRADVHGVRGAHERYVQARQAMQHARAAFAA